MLENDKIKEKKEEKKIKPREILLGLLPFCG